MQGQGHTQGEHQKEGYEYSATKQTRKGKPKK